MVYLIPLIIILFTLCTIINTVINTRRQICFNEMNRIYDKMEVYVFQNGLQNSKSIVTFLMIYKTYVVNNNFADIQILIGVILKQSEDSLKINKIKYDKLAKEIPPELLEMRKEFSKKLSTAIRLSSLRAEFIIYILGKLFRTLVASVVKRSFNGLKRVYNSFVAVIKFNDVILTNNSKGSDYFAC